jgi:uncharacterized alkaline shock family protein YloU
MFAAKQLGADCIIDDGLLIANHQIIAGKSAKKEPTKMASVRRAIFSSEKHSGEVKRAIDEHNFQSILIIGTSDRMVEQIAASVGVGEIERIVRIEEIASEYEIQKAKNIRNKQGKHVIPVPTFEVKKHFSGYFMHPLAMLNKVKSTYKVEEKTVIRPTYSYLGHFEISDKAISDICTYKAKRNPNITKVARVNIRTLNDKSVVIDVDVVMKFPNELHIIGRELANVIHTKVEELTSINVRKLTVNVKGLFFA